MATCPFTNLPTAKSGHWGEGAKTEEMKDYVWLRPETVAEIKFAEWTLLFMRRSRSEAVLRPLRGRCQKFDSHTGGIAP